MDMLMTMHSLIVSQRILLTKKMRGDALPIWRARCLKSKPWMDENRLTMNTSKTEFILFGSRQQLQKTTLSSLSVAGDTVEGASSIKYLGEFLDDMLSMKKQVSSICTKATANILKIKGIRTFF